MIEYLGAAFAGGLTVLVVLAALVRFNRRLSRVRRHAEFLTAYQLRPRRDPERRAYRRLSRQMIGPGGRRRR